MKMEHFKKRLRRSFGKANLIEKADAYMDVGGRATQEHLPSL